MDRGQGHGLGKQAQAQWLEQLCGRLWEVACVELGLDGGLESRPT